VRKIIETKNLDIQLQVTYREIITPYPPRVEECHGFHTFSEDDFDYEIDKITIVTDNHDVDVTEQLKDFIEKYFFN
jgi:hypothetical protein